jgi:transposase
MIVVINHLKFGGESIMNNVTLLGIDLAKNVFQLHGANNKGKAVLKKRISRSSLLNCIANIQPCNIYMEACGSANYWGREFIKLGHKVELINPRYVKPYVKRNKNDANDAAAIVSAARDPEMRFCGVKTEHQQDIQSTHRIRSRAIQQRTALSNQVRGLLAEYGIIIPKGINNTRKHLPKILEDNENSLSSLMLGNILDLYEDLQHLDKKIARYDEKIEMLFENSERSKQLIDIPGIGKLGATILTSILGNGSAFKNGRHFAAFLGLVPKQHSSGEKKKLLGISKGGDTYTRTLLIHGARSVLLRVDKKADAQSIRLKNLKDRCGYNKTAVALANRMARIAWALVHDNSEYNPKHKPKKINAGSLASALV